MNTHQNSRITTVEETKLIFAHEENTEFSCREAKESWSTWNTKETVDYDLVSGCGSGLAYWGIQSVHYSEHHTLLSSGDAGEGGFLL